ncbi:hypothetical protein SDC9_153214 [bioreactor metagenome]|uniref:Uncharacterized protein n=1 Tax=bioreactor metagenome TaxID=1076179 RepID=A0A645EWY9_9ZZZZ
MQHPHIQHHIRFVQDKKVYLVQFDVSLSDQVQQSARCRHQDICSAFQRGCLRILGNTTENDLDLQWQVFSVNLEAFPDLQGKLTGRRKDKGFDGAFSSCSFYRKVLQNRQGKSSGFAGTRLGTTQQVFLVQQMRNGIFLDGRRFSVASLFQCAQQVLV